MQEPDTLRAFIAAAKHEGVGGDGGTAAVRLAQGLGKMLGVSYASCGVWLSHLLFVVLNDVA